MTKKVISNGKKVECRTEILSFRTPNLNFAAYLQASGRLAFEHVESHSPWSQFVFRDPENLGPTIANEFYTQDLKVSARALLAARAWLQNELRNTSWR